MSYQVLARKWRPRSFSTLVGQEHVVRALSHALQTGRLHHAWLFTGTRGVGKTTISRILAKALNCETGVTAEPCGQCPACLAIDADRFPDYIEMDAASNRGVDDMAALLDQAMYTPVQGRYKVYMIDEVHMLTGHAFNAMLKTLEEPPEHVKFILATTDPQKIPVTVLSRCLQFNLKQMPPDHIVGHLSQILQSEQIRFEEAALKHIAKAAAGSMRDALSLLDQSIAHGAGCVETEQVVNMLGTVGDDHLFELLDALIEDDVSAMLGIADAMQARSLSFEVALQALASLLHRLALTQFAPAAVTDATERERLTPYAQAFDAEFLQLAYQVVIHGRDELPLAPDEYAGFTMALLRLHAFRPVSPSSVGDGGPQRLPRTSRVASDNGASVVGSSRGRAPSPQQSPASVTHSTPTVGTAAVADTAVGPKSAQGEGASAPAGQRVAAAQVPVRNASAPLSSQEAQPQKRSTVGDVPPWESLPDEAMHCDIHTSDGPLSVPGPDDEGVGQGEPDKTLSVADNRNVASSPAIAPKVREIHHAATGEPGAGEPSARMPASPAAPQDCSDASAARPSYDGLSAVLAAGDWHTVCQALELGGMLRELAQHCEWLGWDGRRLDLRLSRTHHHLLDLNTNLSDRLTEQLATRLGEQVSVRITIGDIQGQTPAQRDEVARLARHAHAVEALESDPMVRLLIERFDATLVEASVKSL